MADGRRNNGGHSTKGKAGRKPKAGELKEYEAILKGCSFGELSDIVIAMKRKALEGDVPAAKFIFERLFGKAKESIDMTSNGESVRQFDINVIMSDARTDSNE